MTRVNSTKLNDVEWFNTLKNGDTFTIPLETKNDITRLSYTLTFRVIEKNGNNVKFDVTSSISSTPFFENIISMFKQNVDPMIIDKFNKKLLTQEQLKNNISAIGFGLNIVGESAQTGGKRKSKRSRKSRKARKSRSRKSRKARR